MLYHYSLIINIMFNRILINSFTLLYAQEILSRYREDLYKVTLESQLYE